ncbi:Pkinase-domain-containing protein [Metschnikowia bicuspidata var. bicuspidata NRRL YB-4993]|uniref:Serine/threonine-protein kinase BUR1 n=1 Tax=Metschnikowia bicuspidata var. bicuspidata NRRL YB-4993 TaxID=869754 RepID=A0A1A0H800_9ASCO|nr:Pkinase-domain-containing protein [Metschnikowia bicuspidata var. bicuspidata NRRL YB-4993]OBA20023.1 Pkinase-domain-containing protein [Metschnikowia bicuspidata var. bicuspidata NRRL YB-4993]
MSDRYRPPSGPKGPRGAPPPLSRNTWGGPGSRPHHRATPGPPRYRERDHYRPYGGERYTSSSQGGGTSRDMERPSGPSGYRDGPINSQKRSYPEARQGRATDGPNKRREFVSRDMNSGPRSEALEPVPKRADPNLAEPPRGPRVVHAFEKKTRDRPPVNGPVPGPGPRKHRLRPNQIYLVYSVRTSDLYKRVQQVGEGTYGKVYKARNEVTGESVAIKKLRLETEREGFPITAMREIKLLQSFDHPNIVGLLEMMVEYNQITMIFDYLNHDLTGLLTLPDLQLTEGHRKMIFKQLMTGLDYLHKMRVIHRDIKGSNILLNSQGILKIADFGLARNMKVLRDGDSPDYTNRVITIWYRPPELLMGSTDYGREVDIWGVGCLLIELYTKAAIFQGAEEISQLYKIYEVMGTPTAESWPGIENLPWFEMLKPRIKRTSRFEKDFKNLMTDDGFDLAQKLLLLDPGRRITAEKALMHPYFQSDPQPEELKFMESIVGEWHEFETKKRRRDERKRQLELKHTKKIESSVPPSLGKSTQLDSPSITTRSVSATPFEKAVNVSEDSPQQTQDANLEVVNTENEAVQTSQTMPTQDDVDVTRSEGSTATEEKTIERQEPEVEMEKANDPELMEPNVIDNKGVGGEAK